LHFVVLFTTVAPALFPFFLERAGELLLFSLQPRKFSEFRILVKRCNGILCSPAEPILIYCAYFVSADRKECGYATSWKEATG